jgi:hypothetical protein
MLTCIEMSHGVSLRAVQPLNQNRAFFQRNSGNHHLSSMATKDASFMTATETTSIIIYLHSLVRKVICSISGDRGKFE